MTGYFLADWLQLALSLFSCILLLWLGLTVFLNSERRTSSVRRTGGVLLITGTALFGSIFFAAHTALLQIAGRVPAPSLDFWWKTGWLVLVTVPYGWYVIVLWFGGYGERHAPLRLRHRLPAAVLGAAAAGLLLALLFGSPLPSFAQMLALQPPTAGGVLGVPWFLLLYPLYTLGCMVLAYDALDSSVLTPEAALGSARRRAEPWLRATTVVLLVVGLLVGWAIAWFQALPRNGTLSSSAVMAGAAWFDLAVSALLAVVIVMIGQALVHYEIFSGRTLPRRELRRHWNYALLLAGGYGLIVGGSLAYGLRPIYSLLLSAILMAAIFALTGWRTFTRQQEFVRRLHPFVASTHLYEQLTAQPGSQAGDEHTGSTEAGADIAGATFAALCADVLNTCHAVLMPAGPLAMLIGEPLTYPAGAQAPAVDEWMQEVERSTALFLPLQLPAAPQVAWAIPLHSGGQFAGALLLGERNDGGIYMQEEIEAARAAGERLLDLRASSELAQRLLRVQRMRLVESTVLDRQTRRTLHDDLLPDLHAALLLLNQELAANPSSNLQAASDLLVAAHRRTAELLRTIPPRPLLQPGAGFLPLLRRLLDTDFAGQFDSVEWDVAPAAEELAANLPAVTAEVVFYALREAIRNAHRHGRGGDDSRLLMLRIHVCTEDGLHIVVADDGVGRDLGAGQPPPAQAEQTMSNSGDVASGGHGLALHSALLAVVGATMTLNTAPAQGSQVTIHLPPAACGKSPSPST